MGNISKDRFEKDAFVRESLRILHDAYIEKRLVLFVGAGADAPSGLPLWPAAIKKFCNHLGINPKKADNLQVPQYYFNARGKKEYVDLCREIFYYGKDLPINDVHRAVIDFNVSTIITTNYTDFIEREAKNRGYIYKVICQDKDLAYVKRENVIIKMHGDFEHDNFVLKEDDYLQYSNNFRLMETYIKSIIATNVVLFVGYSFSDPDVKQLFTWVKDVLGDDFQQAYMLEGYKNYDKNVFEYYKKLGVNIIYTKSYRENKQNALLSMLDIIRSGSVKEVPNIEKADMYFQPYLELNYILSRYVNKGLRICNLEMEHGIAKSYYRGGERQTEADSILAYLAEKIEKGKSDGSGNIVLNVLKKSGTAKVEVVSKENGILSRLVDVPHEYDASLFDLIVEFDYANLRKKVEYYQFFNNGDDEQIYLKQAYVYYVLKEYEKAYFSLEGAAKSAYRQQHYYTYYIAQFNKCRMGDYIQGITRIPKEMQDKIENDLERIDLQKIIAQIPMSGNSDHQILKDIDSFQLHYSMFQDAYRISENVKKQQETVYVFFGGNPDYIKLQWMIKDYYNFMTRNYLMVDRYRESIEVFKLYVNSIVGSVCAPSKDNAEKQMKNIHASHIGRFELFLMMKYMSNKDLCNMIERNEIDVLPTEDGCIEYIKKVIVNLKSEKVIGDNEFWNCVTLIPYMGSDYEIVETAIDGISEEFSNYSYTVYKRAIYKLLDSAYRKKWFKEKGEREFNIKEYALGRFMDKIICHIEEERESYTLQRYGELVEYVMCIFSQIYEECYERDISKILCAEKCFVAAKMFPYCSENNKEKIKEYFVQWNEEPTVRNVNTYFEVVSKGIIEPRENYEKSIYTYLKRPEPAAQNILSNDNQDILIILYNLYMKEQLICKDDFLKAVEESDYDELRFLNNMDEFDYDKFNLEWLNRYHNSLLEKIAQNDIARSNITKLLAKQVEAGNIDKRLLKKYFVFFTNSQED